MRKIKFRGKVLKNEPLFGLHKGQWIYGNCCYDELQKDVAIENTESSDIIRVLVAEKSVGQFTGLTDKNGKEIYEGDVISYENNTFIVTYDNYRFECIPVDDNLSCYAFSFTEGKVIGNIHDNKDLLNS